MCGKGTHGQIGNLSYQDEMQPFFISKIPDKVQELACGEDHSVVLTRSGEIYTMGSNARGQLGTGSPSRGQNVPCLLKELSFIRMTKVRAGQFSAAVSVDGQLYIWGCGAFGEFYTPHRVKSVQGLDFADLQVGRGGFLGLLTRQGAVFTWGCNEQGQLGQRDCIQRATPHRVEALDGKRVTQIATGNEFVVALGLTLPLKELDKKMQRKSKSQQKAREVSSASKKLHTIAHGRQDYDTVNSSNERVRRPLKPRTNSRSAGKGALNISTIN